MKAAIYNPYLDTLGGGERYTLSFAKVLAEKGYRVDIEWKSPEITKSIEDRFGIDTSGFRVISNINRGDGYDLCFWVSDGSIPALKARKNFLHFQVPFQNVNGKSLINKMKLFRISKIICNSEFTKKIIDEEFGVKSVVLYPPVDTKALKAKRKENIVLGVGRFSRLLQSKHQDVLINVFQQIIDSGKKEWTLILAGGAEVGDDGYASELQKMAQNYPIKIIKSPSWKNLKDLYARSKIFWSASGYGIDERIEPDKVEHFGITVIEAMSAGVVPLVFNAGGHKEIIKNNENGILWQEKGQLLTNTVMLMNNKALLSKFSKSSVSSAKQFSYEEFSLAVSGIL